MKNTLRIIPIFIFVLTAFVLVNFEAKAQTYLPVGPQVSVPESTVTDGGWVECYRDTYDIFINANDVLADCPGERLMLACAPIESNTLMLLAQGERSDVTFDTGLNPDVTHIANGVGWYFNVGLVGGDNEGENAWGFVRAGDSVEKNNCDIDSSGANNERLCWHLQGDVGGYRCGSIGNNEGNLNSGPQAMTYERIVYIPSDEPPVVTEVPTLSEWGVIAMAGVLGVVGFIVARRRKATA